MALSGIAIQIFKIHLNFRAGASIAWYCIIGLTHNGLWSTCEYYLILLDILGENISCIEKSDSVNSEGCHNNERLCRSWERKPPTSVPEGISLTCSQETTHTNTWLPVFVISGLQFLLPQHCLIIPKFNIKCITQIISCV